MASNQSNLIQASNNTNVIKFNGQLEITSVGVAELDKDQCIEVVKKNIQLFGLHTLYYLPGQDGTMLNECDDYHAFTLQEVIDNYNLRTIEPVVVTDSSGDETEQSKTNRFRAYDELEFYDRVFSRLAVEPYMRISLKEKVKSRL